MQDSATSSTVSLSLTYDVSHPATVVLQVAVAAAPERLVERLAVTAAGEALPVSTLTAPAGGRQHLLRVPRGSLTIEYDARVAPAGPDEVGARSVVSPAERIEAMRPSRYCPSDKVLGLAAAEFGRLGSPLEVVRAVCAHVADRTVYTAGSSGPSTDAVDTLLSGTGVCRDYAHAVVMLCRAAGVAARLVSVYAPGLSPMDMHAVVEVEVDGTWTVWDATRLAPRQSLVRIATGRDAADTAFVTVLDGHADLRDLVVTATAPGDLPRDDHGGVVVLG